MPEIEPILLGVLFGFVVGIVSMWHTFLWAYGSEIREILKRRSD